MYQLNFPDSDWLVIVEEKLIYKYLKVGVPIPPGMVIYPLG